MSRTTLSFSAATVSREALTGALVAFDPDNLFRDIFLSYCIRRDFELWKSGRSWYPEGRCSHFDWLEVTEKFFDITVSSKLNHESHVYCSILHSIFLSSIPRHWPVAVRLTLFECPATPSVLFVPARCRPGATRSALFECPGTHHSSVKFQIGELKSLESEFRSRDPSIKEMLDELNPGKKCCA